MKIVLNLQLLLFSTPWLSILIWKSHRKSWRVWSWPAPSSLQVFFTITTKSSIDPLPTSSWSASATIALIWPVASFLCGFFASYAFRPAFFAWLFTRRYTFRTPGLPQTSSPMSRWHSNSSSFFEVCDGNIQLPAGAALKKVGHKSRVSNDFVSKRSELFGQGERRRGNILSLLLVYPLFRSR